MFPSSLVLITKLNALVLGWSGLLGPLHQAVGTGSGGRVEDKEELRRVVLLRAYPIGIDPEPNITVAGMFPPG